MVFTDDYETICTQRTRYCESGSIETPSHGRGKRALIPNGRYISSEDENKEPLHQVNVEKVSHQSFDSSGMSLLDRQGMVL